MENLQKIGKKFVGGIDNPSKVRICENCLKSETKTFENSEKKKCQRKAFKTNLNELKRKAPNNKIKKWTNVTLWCFSNSTSTFFLSHSSTTHKQSS